jgi:hypothetical protein
MSSRKETQEVAREEGAVILVRIKTMFSISQEDSEHWYLKTRFRAQLPTMI